MESDILQQPYPIKHYGFQTKSTLSDTFNNKSIVLCCMHFTNVSYVILCYYKKLFLNNEIE